MPYPRSEILAWSPGTYYHIYNRGAGRANLFRTEDNFLYVLRKAHAYARKFNLSIIAFCLMWNHYHFLLRQDGEFPAGLLIQRVFNGYTKAYNARYQRTGTLFERRYHALEISDDIHLRHLCRYIHANPVKAGFVDDPGGWPYSNYLEWTGERSLFQYDHRFLRSRFVTQTAYAAFVLDYVRNGMSPLPELTLSPEFI